MKFSLDYCEHRFSHWPRASDSLIIPNGRIMDKNCLRPVCPSYAHEGPVAFDFGPENMARSWSTALCLSRSPCATRDYPSLGTIWQPSPYLRLTLSEDL
jgi:hypothetical protein